MKERLTAVVNEVDKTFKYVVATSAWTSADKKKLDELNARFKTYREAKEVRLEDFINNNCYTYDERENLRSLIQNSGQELHQFLSEYLSD